MFHTTDDKCVVIDVFGHCRSCAYCRTFADFHRRYQLCVASDKTIVFNNGSEFVGTVVVAGNGSCSDIDAGTHRCITDISQVINFRSFAYFALLNFDKVSDVYFIGQSGSRTQARKRADFDRVSDDSLIKVRVSIDDRSIADLGVLYDAVRSDDYVVSEDHVSFKNTSDIDENIFAAG